MLQVVAALGFGLDHDKSPEPARLMTVLGVSVRCPSLSSADRAVVFSLDPIKAKVWIDSIDFMLSTRTFPPQEFEALIGRLSFAAFAIFGRWSTSHISSLYAAVASIDHAETVDQEVIDDLRWWRQIITEGRSSHLLLRPSQQSPVMLLTDAEGSGGAGGVLWDFAHPLQECVWFRTRVPSECWQTFKPRKTQINILELVIVLAACRVWLKFLKGRRVLVFIDNNVALQVLRKGRSSKRDLNSWAQRITQLFREVGAEFQFFCIPSKYNLADLPSREAPPPLGTEQPCNATAFSQSAKGA